jgi:hypothetical protein
MQRRRVPNHPPAPNPEQGATNAQGYQTRYHTHAAIVAGLTMPAIAGTKPSSAIGLTPIGTLQRRLTEMAAEHCRVGFALVRMPSGPAREALDARLDELMADCLALQSEIVTLPAENLHDGAVQATVAFYRIDGLTGFDKEDEADIRDLRALVASILLATVKAGGLDIDRLGWGEMRRMCGLRAPQGSAAA